MSSTSYLTATQTPTGFTTNTNITSTSTTGVISSDWANDGSGKYTYSGSLPNQFLIHVDVKISGLATNGKQGLEVIKNGLVNTTSIFPISSVTIPGSTNVALYATFCSTPFNMVNGDYLYLRWTGPTSVSLASASISVIIASIPYKTSISSYLVTTQTSQNGVHPGSGLNGTSVTVTNTSDWSQNGTGQYSYTGTNPIIVNLFLDLEVTGYNSISTKASAVISKNGIDFTDTTSYYKPFKQWTNASASGSITTFGVAQSSGYLLMKNNDYLEVVWEGANANTANYNSKVTITNTKV